MARPSHGTPGGNCVAYAREVSGIHLDGNAAQWWPHAEGRYDRGHQPAVGAILVFKSSRYMRVGHVAVVSKVVGSREILIDHANWVRGRVTKEMSVVDASPNNDWTSVKVLEIRSGTHSRENPTYGFIYPGSLPPDFDRVAAAAERGRTKGRHATQDTGRHAHKTVNLKPKTQEVAEKKAPQPAAERQAAGPLKPPPKRSPRPTDGAVRD
jgi:surface antigen